MTRYAIATDLNLCVGCLACSVACKAVNDVPIGSYWNKVLRIGPTHTGEGYRAGDVDLYFLPVGCQHCAEPECVKVCPTEASHIAADGTVQIDKSKCIGCQFCAMACPYGVRYLNEEERVVEKCTLCEQKIAQGELPQCVSQCGARARYVGDLDAGLESFVGPGVFRDVASASYEDCADARVSMVEYLAPFDDADVHHLPNAGNNPSFFYILRNHSWMGGDE